MQVAIETRNVTHSGVISSARATIKASPKVFNFFSDKIYANKKLAVVRELVANAVDAHVMAGKADEPIEIFLPTPFDQTFRVKDRGVGMSHEFVMGDYMALGDGSTKDQSNDAVGGFGVGKAATFGYTDQYTLRVVHNGTISVYNVFLDTDGVPSINLLQQGETDEVNGVEVSFPVRHDDVSAFEEIVFKNMCYFDPLPIVRNTTKTFEKPNYMASGNGWAMRPTAGHLNVIVGGILYPVVTHSLEPDLKYGDNYKLLLNYGLDLRVPIGSVEIALSREALSYTPCTNQGIKDALDAAVDEIRASFATMFDHHKTLWEAKVALGNEMGLNSSGYSNTRGSFIGKNAQYRGVVLTPTVATGLLDSWWEVLPKTNRRSSIMPKWEKELSLNFSPATVELVVIDDLPRSPASKTTSRLKAFFEDQPRQKRSFVIRPNDHTNFTALLNQLGNPPYVLTSSMPVPAVQVRAKAARPRVRMFTYDGREYQSHTSEQVSNLNPGDGYAARVKGVTEILYADQPATGILVVMDNFNLPKDLRTKMEAKLIRWDELHFVNQSDAAKLKEWQKFNDVFDQRLKAELAKYPDLATQIAVRDHPKFEIYLYHIRRTQIHAELNQRQKATPFGKLCQLYETYCRSIPEAALRLRRYVDPKLPRGVDPDKLVAAIEENTKLTRMLGLCRHSSHDNNDLIREFI